jgi:thymidine phosphorylase
VVLYKKIGESVEVGEPIAKMLTSSPRLLADARPVLESAFAVADEPVPVPSVVLDPLRIFCSSQE